MGATIQDTTYYAIPGHYTIGEAFSTLEDAVSECAARIVRIRQANAAQGLFVPERTYVDERVSDQSGDRIIRRYILEAKLA